MAQQTISKMETVQTAVEWLFEKMAQTPMTNWYEVREQALAIEKEQMENMYNYAMLSLVDTGHGETFDEYYKKIYAK